MNRPDHQFEPSQFEPSVAKISGIDSVTAFKRLCHLPFCLFLDSSLRDPQLGRYSFLAVDPFDVISMSVDDPNSSGVLRNALRNFRQATISDLPPFQGGAAGLISYDYGRSLERVPSPQFDEFQVSALKVGLYDLVVSFDHQTESAWIISQGFPEQDSKQRKARADQRLNWVKRQLEVSGPRSNVSSSVQNSPSSFVKPTTTELLGPNYPIESNSDVGARDDSKLTSNFSKVAYLEAVEKAIAYIQAGDIFQVNFAQRLTHPATCSPIDLYLRLREQNAATFSSFFDLGQTQILSSSPERFLQVQNGRVEARPIKGTRQRTSQPEADLYAGSELKESDKDLSENVMIVDLMRNDLSRVCRADSICVEQLCEIETYAYVQHLVSAVTGELSDEHSAVELLNASFPGGSITGAPKIRAMEIIAELEPHARGAYCGSLGYLGFDGAMDLSILIRTVTASGGWWQIPVGGGIVADSVPQLEYEETWHKAKGMLRAIQD